MITKTLSRLLAEIDRDHKFYSIMCYEADNSGATEITSMIERMPVREVNERFIPEEVVQNPYSDKCVTVYVYDRTESVDSSVYGAQAVLLEDVQ